MGSGASAISRKAAVASRNGNVLSRFEALGDQVSAALDVDEAVIDGEVIVADGTGRPQFYEPLRGTRTPPATSLSMSSGAGTDLRALPLTERSRALFRRGR